MKEIEALCPYLDGPAVYTARALLRGIDSNRMEYMNECEKVYPASNSNRKSQNNYQLAIPDQHLDLSVFPNPANSTILLNHYGSYTTIIIEDMNGRIVFESMLNSNVNSQSFDVSYLANGIYFLKVKGFESNKQLKLIINR